mmetsp:Transcript_54587/g.95436  ORF Transcript_54587/g.95436 Transcript_54587/m.95436 type:complete len:208 (+) Transcript_54587:618-1241(+)
MLLFSWFCSSSMALRPPQSVTMSTTRSSTLAVRATRRMLSRPSSATVITLLSSTESRLHSGGTTPWCTRYMICSGVPPEVALEAAQAASFWMSNSLDCRSSISLGNTLALITAWICSAVPAVILEMVQQASLRMFFLGLSNIHSRAGNALRLMMNCVCESSPVTMLPTVRRAGVWTVVVVLPSSSTNLGATPAFSTAWMRSLGPSEM